MRVLLVCLAAALAAGPLAAQAPAGPRVPSQPDVLRIGAPIRVTTSEFPGAPVVGVFAGVLGDSILVGIPGGSDALRLLRRDMTRAETQIGRRSAAANGVVIGMIAGTAAGGLFALASAKHGLGPTDAGLFLGGGALGALVGGVLGGTILNRARWVVVPLEALADPAGR